MIYFIWLQGLKGPVCQLDYDYNNEYRDKSKILQKHEITEIKSLDKLAEQYPYKGIKE